MGKVLDILSFREQVRTTLREPAVAPVRPAPVPIPEEHEREPGADAPEIPFIEVPELPGQSEPAGHVAPVSAPAANDQQVAFARAESNRPACPVGFSADLQVAHAPDAAEARQYREAAQALGRRLSDERRQALLLAPAGGPDDGTSVAANLALTFVTGEGPRVLLIDADLYARRLATLFSLAPAPGWGDLLAGAEPELAVQESGRPGLHVITAGNRLVAAHAAFRAERVRRLLKRLRTDYEMILLKSPVWDDLRVPGVLAHACDAICLLVARNTAGRSMEAKCAEWIRDEGLCLVGSIWLPA